MSDEKDMPLPHELAPGVYGISDEARAKYGDQVFEALNRSVMPGKPIIHTEAEQGEVDQLRKVVRKMFPSNVLKASDPE